MTRSLPVLQVGIGWILRAGVLLSLILETAGLSLRYLQTGDASLTLSPSWLAAKGNFFDFAYSSVSSVVAGATPFGLVALGITVLMLTPYARVLAAVIYYSAQRDWKYAGITGTVLVVITLGLVTL